MAENLSRFEGLITTDDLDELLDDPTTDPATLVGKKVNWHYTHVLPIVKLHDGGLYLKMRLACGKCGKRTKTVYLGSGLHSGAWCYAYDHNGQYRANLRDQEFVCQECFAKRNQGGGRVMARGAMEYGMANALDLGEVMAEAAKWSDGRWELVSVTPTRMEADKLGVMRAREYLLMFKREKRDG